MSWVEVFVVFVICHLVGDYLLQTDWQATRKRGGLSGPPEARRALFSHVLTYTLSFVPALVWLTTSDETSALGAVGLAALVFVPHLVQDDGRLLSAYMGRVKGAGAAGNAEIFTAVDQSMHMLFLFGTALLATA